MNIIKEFLNNDSKQTNRKPIFLVALATMSTFFSVIWSIWEGINKMPPALWPHALYLIAILCLVFLVIEYKSQIKFKYDENGELWNENEPNIALRIVTFHEMLESMANKIPKHIDQKEAFLIIGRNAGHKFGKHFIRVIYPTVLIKKTNIPFDQLPKSERLNQWTNYDSATGWGLISEKDEGINLRIIAKHQTLFEENGGNGGKLFSYIMAGYAESVVNEILRDNDVKYEVSGTLEPDNGKISFLLKPGLMTNNAHG